MAYGLFISEGRDCFWNIFWVKIIITFDFDSSVVFNGLFGGRLEGIDFSLISPKPVVICVLFLDEGIRWDIGCEECIILCLVGSLGDLSESGTELVLTVFAWNVAAVAGNLGALIDRLTHLFIYYARSYKTETKKNNSNQINWEGQSNEHCFWFNKCIYTISYFLIFSLNKTWLFFILIRDTDVEQIVHVRHGQEAQHSSRFQGYRVHPISSRFPREDAHSPRMLIIRKECPDDYVRFQDCLAANPSSPELCLNLRNELFECGKGGFKKANSDPNYVYWSHNNNKAITYHLCQYTGSRKTSKLTKQKT